MTNREKVAQWLRAQRDGSDRWFRVMEIADATGMVYSKVENVLYHKDCRDLFDRKPDAFPRLSARSERTGWRYRSTARLPTTNPS